MMIKSVLNFWENCRSKVLLCFPCCFLQSRSVSTQCPLALCPFSAAFGYGQYRGTAEMTGKTGNNEKKLLQPDCFFKYLFPFMLVQNISQWHWAIIFLPTIPFSTTAHPKPFNQIQSKDTTKLTYRGMKLKRLRTHEILQMPPITPWVSTVRAVVKFLLGLGELIVGFPWLTGNRSFLSVPLTVWKSIWMNTNL